MSSFFVKDVKEKYIQTVGILCLLAFLCFDISAQDRIDLKANSISFEHITKKNGLSSEIVNASLKDSKGFVWFATSKGLNRFDGVEMKVFEHIEEDSNSISNNYVKSLFEDKAGNIWIGTQGGGLNKYDYQTDKFSHYFQNRQDPNSLCDDYILQIYEDKEGLIWLGTENGISIFNPKTECFSNHFHDPNDESTMGSKAVLRIYEDAQQQIWIGNWGGGLNLLTHRISNNDGDIKLKFRRIPLPELADIKNVWSILRDSQNKLWIGSFGGGLLRIDNLPEHNEELKTFQPEFTHFFVNLKSPYKVSNEAITDLTEDSFGRIWIGTLFGLNIFQKSNTEKEGHFIKFFERRGKREHLTSSEIWDLHQDKDGVIWCAAYGGVNMYDPSSKAFKRFYPFHNSEPRVMVKAIVIDDKDNHWIGTMHRGIYKYNPQTGEKKYYLSNLSEDNNIFGTGVNGMCLDRENKIWAGTMKGVSIIDLEKDKIESIPILNKGSHQAIRCVFVDSKKRIWLTSIGGLIQLFKNEETIDESHYEYTTIENSEIASNDIFDIGEDKFGNIWLATFSGVCKFSIDENNNKKFTTYQSNPKDTTSLLSDRLMSMNIEEEGIWFGAETGISYFDFETEKFRNPMPKNITISHIGAMQADDIGNLWMTSRDGLYRYNVKNYNARQNAKK